MNANKEIEMFLTYLKNVKNRSDKTITAYKIDLNEFFLILSDIENISQLTKNDVENKYINKLVESGNCASSRARKLSALRSFFKWAVANNVVVENPVESVEMPKIPHKEPKVMDDSEVENVIKLARKESLKNNCDGFRNLAIISLFFNTGIRREELTNIKLKDVNLSDSSIVIHGKGNKERTVYFNGTVRAILSEFIASHRNNFKTAEKSEFLFVSTRAEKMCPSTVNKIVNEFYQKANIKEKGYTVHSTRKAFATKVYKNTNDIVATQYLLGHSNPQTTMRYVGASEQMKKKAAMTVNF